MPDAEANPAMDVESADAVHFLCRAGDPATWCTMDAARRVDGPATACEFA